MQDLEPLSMWGTLLGLIAVVLFYYAGTRGVFALTSGLAGRWHRSLIVSLSFAVLFAPSLLGFGHAGVVPAPAWFVAIEYAREGIWSGVVRWGLLPVLLTWVVFFAVSSFSSALSKNNNKKVDAHGKEP
jgi:hypothetical protein